MIPFPKLIMSALVSLGSLLSTTSDATAFRLYFPDNDPVELEVDPQATVGEIEKLLSSLEEQGSGEVLLALQKSSTQTNVSQGAGYSYDINNGARDFYREVKGDEKSNIAYIVKTLANKHETSLLVHKGSIQSAGKRVDHVHPLKFLSTIFENEELKVGMRNIRKRSWVWGNFRDGIADSLRDEQNVDNMKEEYLYEFAAPLKLDVNTVYALYVNGQWKEFVEALVTHVPRKGNPKRFNMSQN